MLSSIDMFNIMYGRLVRGNIFPIQQNNLFCISTNRNVVICCRTSRVICQPRKMTTIPREFPSALQTHNRRYECTLNKAQYSRFVLHYIMEAQALIYNINTVCHHEISASPCNYRHWEIWSEMVFILSPLINRYMMCLSVQPCNSHAFLPHIHTHASFLISTVLSNTFLWYAGAG